MKNIMKLTGNENGSFLDSEFEGPDGASKEKGAYNFVKYRYTKSVFQDFECYLKSERISGDDVKLFPKVIFQTSSVFQAFSRIQTFRTELVKLTNGFFGNGVGNVCHVVERHKEIECDDLSRKINFILGYDG